MEDAFPLFPSAASQMVDDFFRNLDTDPLLSNLNRQSSSSNGASPPQGFGLDRQASGLNTPPPFSPLAELDGPAFQDLNGSNSSDDMRDLFSDVAVNASLDFAPPTSNADSHMSPSRSRQELSIGGDNEKSITSPSPSSSTYDQELDVTDDSGTDGGQARTKIFVPANSGRMMVMVPQAVPKLNPLLQYLKHCGSGNSKMMQRQQEFQPGNRFDSSGQVYRWGECMTSAAVRARERRRENKQKYHGLEATVHQLSAENQQLRLENAQMRREMDSLRTELTSLRSLIPLFEQIQQQGSLKRVQVVVHPTEIGGPGSKRKSKPGDEFESESECGHSAAKRRSTRHISNSAASYPCNVAEPCEALSDRQLIALDLLHRNNVESMPQLVIVKSGGNEEVKQEMVAATGASPKPQRVVVLRKTARPPPATKKNATGGAGQSVVLVAAE